MSLNDVPSGERVHIGFFGARNSGKSSLVNAVTGQNLSIVSDVKGTTTDPVSKAMEILPMGPVVIIDTPGIDDTGKLGELRITRTRDILKKVDVAVLVVDSSEGLRDSDQDLISLFKERDIPYIVAYNKSDLKAVSDGSAEAISVSAKDLTNINELKDKIASLAKTKEKDIPLIQDLVSPGGTVILVIPIDSSAPKGRLILPQQQVIREALEAGIPTLCVQPQDLDMAIKSLKDKPSLVITDSQAFRQVDSIVPDDILLTSFSILMARHKGILEPCVEGLSAIDSLEDGDKILISEGCTHHRQCEDIGTVKIPNLIKRYTGKNIEFDTTSGLSFEDDLTPYKIVIHCGGCMLNDREMKSRINTARSLGCPITNYGLAIAYMNGILLRSIKVFPDLYKLAGGQDV